MTNFWTDKERGLAIAGVRAGFGYKVIARRIQRSPDAIREEVSRLRQQGYDIQKPPKRMPLYSVNRWTDADVASLLDLLRTGCTTKQAAKRLGRSLGSVERKLAYLRRKGIVIVRGRTVVDET